MGNYKWKTVFLLCSFPFTYYFLSNSITSVSVSIFFPPTRIGLLVHFPLATLSDSAFLFLFFFLPLQLCYSDLSLPQSVVSTSPFHLQTYSAQLFFPLNLLLHSPPLSLGLFSLSVRQPFALPSLSLLAFVFNYPPPLHSPFHLTFPSISPLLFQLLLFPPLLSIINPLQSILSPSPHAALPLSAFFPYRLSFLTFAFN